MENSIGDTKIKLKSAEFNFVAETLKPIKNIELNLELDIEAFADLKILDYEKLIKNLGNLVILAIDNQQTPQIDKNMETPNTEQTMHPTEKAMLKFDTLILAKDLSVDENWSQEKLLEVAEKLYRYCSE